MFGGVYGDAIEETTYTEERSGHFWLTEKEEMEKIPELGDLVAAR